MRYIPNYTTRSVLQISEGESSYINIKNVGASGGGETRFTSTVTDIQSSIVTLGNINDGQGGQLNAYRGILKSDTDLQAFFYAPPGSVQDKTIVISTFVAQGVDFSSSEFVNTNLRPLKYIVFGYNIDTGFMPNAREVVEIGTKVLNPDFWNIDQYVQLNITRSSLYVLPVIYRVWGNRVDFLGLVGNNTISYSNSATFRDLGLTEIPSWDTERALPIFLQGAISVAGSDVIINSRVLGKEKLNIRPTLSGSLPNTLSCFCQGDTSKYDTGNTVRFYTDDTRYLQTAVNLARSGGIKDIFFPSDTYNISDVSFVNSSLNDYSNISFRGVGEGSIVKRLPSIVHNVTNPGLVCFSGGNTSNPLSGVKFESIVFDGNRNNNASVLSPRASETTLNILLSESLTIRYCLIRDNASSGVGIEDCKNVSLLNNRISRTGRAYEEGAEPLSVLNSENLVTQGNILELATSSPKIDSTDFSTVNGNIVRGCGDRGFDLQSSFQWNSQGNVAYSDNDSIIRSIDTYNNEYSRATIEVRKGFALDPIFMTVTYGGEPVSIVKGSVKAEIFSLTSQGVKNVKVGSFRVIETSDQLEAGIFSLTLPGTTSQELGGETIIATGSLNNEFGYIYEVKANVLIGGGPRGYTPLSLGRVEISSEIYPTLKLVNSSDILSLQIHAPSGLENDKVLVKGFLPDILPGWDQNASYPIRDVDVDTATLILEQIPGFSPPEPPVEFGSGSLFISRPDYFVADGNLFVHTL
jgi:hypothetical protein